MPRGSHAKGGLRSHRRRIGKHLILAPWIIITVVGALVLAGLTTGYVYLVTRGCDGEKVTATVVADPSIAGVLEKQAQNWNSSEPSVNGQCAAVTVIQKDSASAAAALAPSWDPRVDGPRPDVWVPESSLWTQLAASRQDAARMLPDKQPSLARSPAVLAMPEPMGKAIGAPHTKLTWHDLATAYAGSLWAQHGHPDWGEFKVDMTDPTVSTAGLHALAAMADANGNGDITKTERESLNRLWQVRADYKTDTDSILQKLSEADVTSSQAAMKVVSAFPALEQDVVAYNDTNPRMRLTAAYPSDGSADADFPYLVLGWPSGTPHIDPTAQHHRDDVARTFLDKLRGKAGRDAFLNAGYRDPNRKPGASLTADNGVARTVPTMPRAVMTPDSISQAVSNWTAISRATNTLLVVDTSTDMGDEVPGTGKTKLQIAGDAAAEAINLFGSLARIGLWAYSSDLAPDEAYKQLVPVGNINDPLDGGTRGTAIRDDLSSLQTSGQPGLFNTATAAYHWMRQHYVPDASNQIVIITGSGQDSGNGKGLSDVTTELSKGDKNHPLPVITVGYGKPVDLPALQTLSQASGGRAYATDSPTEVSKLLLTALFSSAPAPH